MESFRQPKDFDLRPTRRPWQRGIIDIEFGNGDLAFPTLSTTIVDMKTKRSIARAYVQPWQQSAKARITRARIGWGRKTMPIVTRDSVRQIALEFTASPVIVRRNEITRDAQARNPHASRVMDAHDARQDGIVSRIHIRLKTKRIRFSFFTSELCARNGKEYENG